MWIELKDTDTKELEIYKSVMDKMDKFYLSYTVEKYAKHIRRGDRSFYYNDGELHYFITFHWNPLRDMWKIICVGFTGSDEPNTVADIGFEKVKAFMIETSSQLYGTRPNVMDDPLINIHHDRWI